MSVDSMMIDKSDKTNKIPELRTSKHVSINFYRLIDNVNINRSLVIDWIPIPVFID